MSFFDEDDEPRRRARPRGSRSAAAGRPADSQTLLLRRIVAVVAIVVVAVLLAVAVNSCRNSQQRNSLKDYNRRVTAIGLESQQTGQEFFQLLNRGGGQSSQDLQAAVSSLRVQADNQRLQAERLDVPGEMEGAQQSLLIALEERRDGLGYVASRIRTALGDDGAAADAAIRQISGQMSAFLASDVLFQGRVRPFIQRALDDREVGGQAVGRSRFLPDAAWLSPTYVAQRFDQQLAGGTGGQEGQPTGPGLHGTGIDSTSFGDVTLQPGVANRLTFSPGQGFAVAFTNQGENDEFDVQVSVRISGGAGAPITLRRTVPKIAQGTTATPTLSLTRTPPIGAAVTIDVSVAPVPGERKTDNNRAQYNAIFQRG